MPTAARSFTPTSPRAPGAAAPGPTGSRATPAHIFAHLASHSVEITEAEQPIQILGYEFLPDRGGAGCFRGGAPFYREYRFLEHEAILQVRSDRRNRRSFGLYGGSAGQPSLNVINPGRENRVLPGKFTTTIYRGDVYRHEIAGPGGWGDPFERAPWRVLRDVQNELVSIAAARQHYGVVIHPSGCEVDEAETLALRAELRARRGWSGVPAVVWDDGAAAAGAAGSTPR